MKLRGHFNNGGYPDVFIVFPELPGAPFQDTEPRTLSVESDGSLPWPAGADGFVLMHAGSLDGHWMQTTNSAVVADGKAPVTLGTTNGMQFYRLEKP